MVVYINIQTSSDPFLGEFLQRLWELKTVNGFKYLCISNICDVINNVSAVGGKLNYLYCFYVS